MPRMEPPITNVLGLDDGWLQARLRDAGVRSPREVFLLSVDEAGSVVCLPKEGKA